MNEFHFTLFTKWRGRTENVPLAMRTTRLLRFVVMLCIGLYGSNLNAQCPNTNTQEGGPAATVLTTETETELSAAIDAGEYHLVSVVAGNTYVFETGCTVGTPPTTQITLYGAAAAALANGECSVTYTPSVTEDIRVLVNDGTDCATTTAVGVTLNATLTCAATVLNDGLAASTVTPNETTVTLNSTIYGGRYHIVSVVAGDRYVFETCGSDAATITDFTLYEDGGTVLLASSAAGTGGTTATCANGSGSFVAYTATATANIWVQMDGDCTNSMSLSATAATPDDCADCSGVTNIGLSCLSSLSAPSVLINLDACAASADIQTEPDVVTTISGDGSGYSGNAQLVTRTYTIDQDGDFTTLLDQVQCTHALTVESNPLGIASTPDITIQLSSGECRAQVFYNTPGTSGGCNRSLVRTAGMASGSMFEIGTTVITHTLTDVNFPDVTVTESFNIIIEGNESTGTMACGGSNIALGPDCTHTATATDVLEGDGYGCVEDFVTSVHLTDVPNAPAIPTSPLITSDYVDMQLVIKVMDPATNNSCWSWVLIEDKLGPEITCTQEVIELDCGVSTAPTAANTPEAIDNCEGAITPTYTDVITTPNCAAVPYRVITRTWTATDSKGNTATCTQTININRQTLDDITCPVQADLVCDAGFAVDTEGHPSPDITGRPTFDGTLISNMCMFNFAEGANGLPYTDIVFPGDCEGNITYKRTWMILDMCSGEMEACTQTIKVTDTEGPEIDCPDNTTANAYTNCVANFIVPTPTITDDCSSTGINYSVASSAGTVIPFGSGHIVNGLPLGTHTITYTAYDGCDNSSTCSFEVTVEDHQAPVLPCQTNTTIGLSNDGSLVHWNTFLNLSDVTDNCGVEEILIRRMDMAHCVGDDSSPYAETVPFSCCDIGNTVTIEVQATDINGNVNSCMVFATVMDNVAPIFSPCPPSTREEDCDNLAALNVYDDVTEDADGIVDVPAPGALTYIITFDNPTPDTTFFGYYNNNIWDNCDTEVYIWTTGSVDECGNSIDANGALSPLVRRYVAVDQSGNVSTPCIQNITVSNPDEFDPATDITQRPADYVNPGAACGTSILPDDLPAGFQRPVVNSTIGCDNIAMGYSDSDELYPVGGSENYCYKVLRTWYIFDWCGMKHDTSTQVIMVVDPGPAFTGCQSPAPLADGATLVLEPVAMNLCASPAVAVDVTYSVDLNNDGTVELTDIPGTINEAVGVGTNFPEGIHRVIFTAEGCTASSTCEVLVEVMPPAPPSAMSNVSGAISNEYNSMVENVTVTPANGMGSYVTDINGAYDMDLATSENYNVTPEKNDDYLNGVSTYDIVLMSKHILQLELLDSPYKMIAADVNKSGSITTLDMVELRKIILFINDEFPNNTSWRFVDANYAFPDATNPFGEIFPESYAINGLTGDMEDLDFVAVKIGDVNGTAETNGFNEDADSRDFNGTLELEMNDVQLKAGQTKTIEVKANDFNQLLGYQFTMAFEGLEVIDVTAGELTSLTTANFGMQRLQEGVLTTSWNNNEAVSLADGTVLFTVTVRATADVQLSEVLRASSQYTAAEAYADKAGDVEIMNVEFTFRDNNGATIASGFDLYQNRPNPFKDETVIGFDLPQAGKAQINVYDLSGKVLLNVSGTYAKGYNEVSINRSDLPGTGVLYYELATEYNSAVRKMTIIE